MQKEVHVVASKSGWSVQLHGLVLSTHQSEGVAVERALKAAKRYQFDLIVHARDGKVSRRVHSTRRSIDRARRSA